MTKSAPVSRKASLFRNGRSQAIRIPKEFEFPGKEVRITKEGDRLVVEPMYSKESLIAFLRSLEPLDIEWPEIDDPLPEDVAI
jgi:antitoxin VapB